MLWDLYHMRMERLGMEEDQKKIMEKARYRTANKVLEERLKDEKQSYRGR